MEKAAKGMRGGGCGGSGAAGAATQEGAQAIPARPAAGSGAGMSASGALADAREPGGGEKSEAKAAEAATGAVRLRAAQAEERTGSPVVTASDGAVSAAGGGAASAGRSGRGRGDGLRQPEGGKEPAAAGSVSRPEPGAGVAAGSPMAAAVTARPRRRGARRDLLRPETPWAPVIGAPVVEAQAGGAAAAGAGVSGARGAAGRAALSAAALRILRRLAGGPAALEAVGDTAVGRAISAARQELLRHDLARYAAGRWAITAPGLSYLRRLDEGRRLRRLRGAPGPERMGDRGGAVPPPHSGDPADLAEAYRAQHGDFALEESPGAENPAAPGAAAQGGAAKRLVNRGESTLGWLRRRRDGSGRPLVDERQFAAGERLRGDFEHAGMLARVTVRWDGDGARGGRRWRDAGVPDPTESQLMARQRYDRALEALGPGLAEVATRVCCYQEGLESVERSRAWPARSAKVVLGLALDRLALFYGIG